jgi:hypothetical protein
MVTAGESLAIELSPSGFLVSGDAYASGMFEPFRVPDPTQDLQFKSFILLGTSTSQAPTFASGDRSAALAWVPMQYANSYDIEEQAADGSYSTVSSTTDSWTLISGLPIGSAHTSVLVTHFIDGDVQSQPVSVPVLSAFIDQANAGDVSTSGQITVGPATGPLAQSFTAGASGTLAGVELAATSSDVAGQQPTFEILNASGTVLGAGTLVAAGPAIASGLLPLTSPLRTGTFVDFSALGVQVTAGVALSIRITSAAAATMLRDTPDLYAGGAEGGPGAIAGRDLVFRSDRDAWSCPQLNRTGLRG